jgi:hypothetical protein
MIETRESVSLSGREGSFASEADYHLTRPKISDRARERARGRKLNELTTRKLRIGAGRGSLHRPQT